MHKKEKTKPIASWNEKAELWAKQVRSKKDVFRDLFNNPEFFKFIGDIKNKKILDAGCGEGYNTRLLAQKGADVTAIDLSENMIYLAQQEENKHTLGIKYKIASFTDLSPFKNNSFDTVVSTMALMDGPDYNKAVREFYRVLKPGGNLFFSITHPCFFTPGYKRCQDEQGKWKMVVGNYFKEEPYPYSFNFTKKNDRSDLLQFNTLKHHRTISTYINELITAGFTLKKIKEPKPSKELCKKFPRLQKAYEAGSFLYLYAQKT